MRFFGRGKDEDKDFRQAVMANVLLGESQRAVTEQEVIRDLGVNPYLIRSFTLQSIMESLYKNLENQKETDENKFLAPFDILALAGLTETTIRVSFLSLPDSQICYIKSRRILRRIRMHSPKMKGLSNFIEVIDLERLTAFNDAVEGRKAKLTKVTPRTMEVTMRQTKKEGGLLT